MNRKTAKPSEPAKKNRKKSGRTSGNIYSMIPFVLLVVSILLESCLLFPNSTGVLGQAVRNFMCGLFGAVSYLIPAGLLMLALCFFEIRRCRSMVMKLVTLSMFVLFFSACQSVAGDPALTEAPTLSVLYDNGTVGVGGGAVGGLFGRLMIFAFDKPLSIVLSVVICLISLSLFVGAKKMGLWHYAFTEAGKRIHRKEKTTSTGAKAQSESSSNETKPDAVSTQIAQTAQPTVIENTVSAPAPKPEQLKEPEPISERYFISPDYDPFLFGSELDSKSRTSMPSSAMPSVSTAPDTTAVTAPVQKPQPVRTNENPMTARAVVRKRTSGGGDSWSPFSDPFHEQNRAEEQSYKSYRPTDNGGEQRSYSPFSDPFASMKDSENPRPRINQAPQSYIACGANYPNSQGSSSSGSEAPSDSQDEEGRQKKSRVLNFLRRPSEGGIDDIYSEEVNVRQSSPSFKPSEQPISEPRAYTEHQTPKTSIYAEQPQPTTQQAQSCQQKDWQRPQPHAVDPDFYRPPFDMNDEYENEDEDDEIEVDQPEYERPTADSNGGSIRQVYGAEPRYPNYAYPQFDLLDPPKPLNQISDEVVMEVRNTLLEKLASFRVEATLSGYSIGPTITRYEITPGPGVKVRQITALTDDLALALQSDGVRIATVSGKSVIGVEVPNEKVSVVSLRALLESREFINAKSRITVCVGLTVTGKPVYMDIDDMPHVLIAGETKSGKSVAINCMILSLLYRASPDEVQLILIDPKRVELNIYSKIPHLIMPVIDDPKRAAAALRWAVNEMDRRYMLLDKMGVRNREEYCELRKQDPSLELMPQIIIVIDELADLMLQVREYVEELINRLAAMARACGIHLLVGTQRPSVDIITGLIKANIPARIAFKVSSAQDSRIILGGIGAEKLLGRGDMLYQATGAGRMRIQGAFVSGAEIKRLTNFLIERNGPADFDPEILRSLDAEMDRMNKSSKKSTYTDDDEDSGTVDGYEPDFDLLCRAIEYILETGKTSTNVIQRVLHIGFNRAADIVDTLEDMGFLSAREGNRPREVQVTWEMYEEWKLRKQL